MLHFIMLTMFYNEEKSIKLAQIKKGIINVKQGNLLAFNGPKKKAQKNPTFFHPSYQTFLIHG